MAGGVGWRGVIINMGLKNSLRYNKRGGVGINAGGGGLFVYFDHNDLNVSKFVLCINKVVIYGMKKKCENKLFRFNNMTW